LEAFAVSTHSQTLSHLGSVIASDRPTIELIGGSPLGTEAEYPRQESNLRTRFRKPLLYPLSYGGRTAGYQRFSRSPLERGFLYSGGVRVCPD
jgi:hypothetical protein